MKNLIVLISIMSLAVCLADGPRLLNRGKNRQPVIELTESEKALDIDSFAGFKFGTEVTDPYVANGRTLDTPFRAFTRIQLMRTDSTRRLCGIHLFGDIDDWPAQSVTNEIAFLRGMLADQYRISSWQTDSEPWRSARIVFRFKNDNVSISLSANNKWLSLDVTSLRVKANDEREHEAAKTRVVKFPESQGFAELARLAEKIKTVDGGKIKPTIPSGELGDIRILDRDTTAWESSEGGGKEQTIFLPCRSVSADSPL